jgi:hypothetical protein
MEANILGESGTACYGQSSLTATLTVNTRMASTDGRKDQKFFVARHVSPHSSVYHWSFSKSWMGIKAVNKSPPSSPSSVIQMS